MLSIVIFRNLFAQGIGWQYATSLKITTIEFQKLFLIPNNMTQKEKLHRATMMANRIKSIARSLRVEANVYDVKFPYAFADELESVANEYLKLK